MYDAVLSETVTITGHGGDAIEAYSARPLTPGPVGGVVVLHHLPGYDRQTKEFTRSLAVGGVNAVMPNLYSREAPGADPDDAMAAARSQGAIPVPDERVVGEDQYPSPEHVAELEAALSAAGKAYKFRTYEGANHGFLQVDSSRYHAESAVDAWREILDWFGRYLAA
jgi:carboxymethylenebutenolidase